MFFFIYPWKHIMWVLIRNDFQLDVSKSSIPCNISFYGEIRRKKNEDNPLIFRSIWFSVEGEGRLIIILYTDRQVKGLAWWNTFNIHSYLKCSANPIAICFFNTIRWKKRKYRFQLKQYWLNLKGRSPLQGATLNVKEPLWANLFF